MKNLIKLIDENGYVIIVDRDKIDFVSHQYDEESEFFGITMAGYKGHLIIKNCQENIDAIMNYAPQMDSPIGKNIFENTFKLCGCAK